MCAMGAREACAQDIASLKRSLAGGGNAVRVTETPDAAAAVRAVDQRTKRTKVNGYTIVILFDNSQQARENAVEAKETFEENFKGVNIDVTYENPWFTVSVGRYLTMEEAIIELGRIRSVFPKAFPRPISSSTLPTSLSSPGRQPLGAGYRAGAARRRGEQGQGRGPIV